VTRAVSDAGPEAAPPAIRDVDEAKLAWTDAPVVDALTKDCAYLPEGAKEADGNLSCSGGLFYQSCVADPCFTDGQSNCRPRCQKACAACETGCTSSCDACKARCADDACRRRCAEACGACKQACLGAKDRCATGTCGAEYVACAKRLKAQWKASGCPKACPTYNECFGTCNDEDEAKRDACWERCRAALRRACPAPLAGMCMFNGFGPEQSMGDAPP
jgi:hypothetical protein